VSKEPGYGRGLRTLESKHGNDELIFRGKHQY